MERLAGGRPRGASPPSLDEQGPCRGPHVCMMRRVRHAGSVADLARLHRPHRLARRPRRDRLRVHRPPARHHRLLPGAPPRAVVGGVPVVPRHRDQRGHHHLGARHRLQRELGVRAVLHRVEPGQAGRRLPVHPRLLPARRHDHLRIPARPLRPRHAGDRLALLLPQRLTGSGARLTATAIAVSLLVGWRIETTIVVTVVVSIAYIATGGVSAVVWTNVFQALMFLGAGALTLGFLVSQIDGGVAAIVQLTEAAGRLRIVDWGPAPGAPDFWTLLAGGRSEDHYLRVSRACVVVSGVVLGIIAWVFLGWRQQILWLVFKIAGVPFGSLLGVFLLGLLSRRRVADVANVVAMVMMTLINLTLLYLAETGRISFPWSWLVIVGTVGTIAISLALTPLLPARTTPQG